MITGAETSDVTICGELEQNAFAIKASAKAFQILASNLYSNPLGSMIRELSTNAYDAHVMVNTPEKPFHIKLPNPLEPWFIIRDFGPGLSEQEIKSVYTTFFESTKTDSNDVVGCLGLGSKSPFGVSDSFTINSYYNGTVSVYCCFLNNQRIPTIAKFQSAPTHEPNGIEIQVAIKAQDINTFAEQLNHQLKYFVTKPTVSGNSGFEWHTQETYMYQGTDWKMVYTQGQYNPGARVVQGQIAYPISTHDMGTAFDNASDAVRTLLNKSVLFTVRIGDVNIAPSREALVYDENTNKNIIKAAEKVLEELPETIAAAIQDQPTQWEARIKYKQIMQDLGMGYNSTNPLAQVVAASAASGKILWKNKDVSTTDILLRTQYANKITEFSKQYNGRYIKQQYHPGPDRANAFAGKKKDDSKFWTVQARNLENTQVVWATSHDTAVPARAKQWADDKLGAGVSIIIIESDKSYTTIKRLLGIPTLVKASDLPKVRSGKPAPQAPVSNEIPVQKFYSTWAKSYQWTTHYATHDLLDLTGYYVDLERFDAVWNGQTLDVKAYWNAAKTLGLVDSESSLWGLRKTNRTRPHNLVNFFQHCKDTLAAKYNDTIGVEYSSNDTASKIHEYANRYMDTLLDKVQSTSPTSPMMTFLKKLAKYRDMPIDRDSKKLLKLLGFDNSNKKENIDHIVQDFDSRYPMIPQLGYGFDAAVVAQYINQMDKLAELEK